MNARAIVGAVTLCALAAGACGGAPDPSLDDVVAALTAQGIRVAERTEARNAIQQEFENANEALATGAPIPKLVRRVTLDGIPADLFVCPGKAEQANQAIAVRLRGLNDGDPPLLGVVAEVLTGHLNLAVGRNIVSMRPTPAQDDAALKVARALATVLP